LLVFFWGGRRREGGGGLIKTYLGEKRGKKRGKKLVSLYMNILDILLINLKIYFYLPQVVQQNTK
jgi:hypothetical protein